jgi:predicted nucleic acid-binding protein
VSVVIDTTIWSLALRRRPQHLSPEETVLVRELEALSRERRAHIIGPIRQEILSGIPEESTYERVRMELRFFDDEPLTTTDFEVAARLYNQCRAGGIAGSDIDLLICAAALERNWSIFTMDRDFTQYRRVLPIQLHTPRTFHPLH